MINLNRLQSFLAIVEAGSFTRAAEQLGLTKAMVSMHLKQLEADLGVALLTRTTRRISLTETGERFYRDCVRVVRAAEAAVDDARVGHAALSGVLRVTSTAEYGTHFVVPALAEFARMHPSLRIEFSASYRSLDLIQERFDVAIRLGQLPDSTHRAVALSRFRLVAVATPAYLATRSLPGTPDDLRALDWVAYAAFDMPSTWTALGEAPRKYTVPLTSRIQADSAAAVLGFVLAHSGATMLAPWTITEHVAQGRLVALLPGYVLPENGVFAVYPGTEHVPAKVRAFVDFVRAFKR